LFKRVHINGNWKYRHEEYGGIIPPRKLAGGGLEDINRKISNRFTFNSVVYLIFNFAGSLKNLTFELSKIFILMNFTI
jgi:hypothetical protein